MAFVCQITKQQHFINKYIKHHKKFNRKGDFHLRNSIHFYQNAAQA